jgi:hypothetical protein
VHVWTWRGGKAVRMDAFLSKEQALEAVGRTVAGSEPASST